MKPAASLTMLGTGGILALAIHGHPGFLNLQAAGWVLMLTGLTGLLLPFRKRGWLHRTWKLLIGEPRRPAAGEDELDYVPSGLHRPAGADPDAPDADYPTLPDIWADHGGMPAAL